jgi:hypothetical protein
MYFAWGASGRPFESGRSDKKPFQTGKAFFMRILLKTLNK